MFIEKNTAANKSRRDDIIPIFKLEPFSKFHPYGVFDTLHFLSIKMLSLRDFLNFKIKMLKFLAL